MASPLKTIAKKLAPAKPAPRRDVATKPVMPIGKGGRRDVAVPFKPRGK